MILFAISVGVAVEEYVCNPDKTIITNNLNCNGHFECCDRATSKAPNEPYGYFNYGCYLILNAFNQIVSTSINEKGSQVEQVDHFTYNEGFTLFNTTLTGNPGEERETYSASLSSPVYLIFG